MNVIDLFEAFEAGTLDPKTFRHRDHIQVTWMYLKRFPLPVVIARVSEGLKRLARAAGKESLYHETITWAFIFIISERMKRLEKECTWEEFEARNADLMNWKESVLRNYYRQETLKSDLARTTFVLPDRIEAPVGELAPSV